MFDQSLFNSLVRGLAVLCDGTVVNARLGNGGLAVRQSPVSQLSLRPSWQPDAEPEADERDYAIAASAAKRAGRPVRTAGPLSSRTRHGEGTSLTAVVGIELLRSLLRMQAEVTEVLKTHNRESEVSPWLMTD